MAVPAQTKRVLLLAFLGSIAACGLVGIYALIAGGLGRIDGAILGSTALVGAAAILGVASAVPWEQRRWHPIGPVGVVAVAAALALSLFNIWTDVAGGPPSAVQSQEQLWRAAGVLWVFAAGVPHVGLLSLARLHRSYEWVRRGTVVVIAAIAALLVVLILEFADAGDFWMRVLGVLAILDVCGTIAVPVLHRVSTIHGRETQQTVELTVALTCPRCGSGQTLSVGRSRCGQCGLKFLIEIEEDQCRKCGYPLYRLESTTCPECGTPIAASSAARAE